MMVYHPEDDMGYEIWQTFLRQTAPDQYDEHDVMYRCIDNSELTGVQIGGRVGLNRQTYGGSQVLTSSEVKANAQKIHEMLERAHIANLLVARWFNLTGDSLQNAYFNTEVLQQRGQYDVSVVDAKLYQYTIEGVSGLLVEASEDLLQHTFVLVNDITVAATAQDRAKSTKVAFSILGGLIDAFTGTNNGQRLALDVGDIADAFDGYKIVTHSYLYQLIWNDSISNEFYTRYYTEQPDAKKMRAFLQDGSLFHLKYLGHNSSKFDKSSTRYNQVELLRYVTTRSIDSNIAELQMKYDDFRVRVPITELEYNTKAKQDCYRAPIGLKEGVTDKARFEVLDMEIDPKTLKAKYKRVAVLQPIKTEIWDNRFNAVQELEKGANLTGTLFKRTKGSQGKIAKGMLIRQISN